MESIFQNTRLEVIMRTRCKWKKKKKIKNQREGDA